MADLKKEDVIEWLSNQSVLDIAGLVKDLEEKWGVSAAAPVAVAAAPGAVEEKPLKPLKKRLNSTLSSPKLALRRSM